MDFINGRARFWHAIAVTCPHPEIFGLSKGKRGSKTSGVQTLKKPIYTSSARYTLVNPFEEGQDKPNPEVSEAAPAVPTTDRNATSDKQIEANARDAKRSTGPRTEAGKVRSSQNATKYGFYQKELLPIPSGPMAEDQATIEEFIDGVVASLEPRDPAEQHVARQIAHELLRGARR